MSEQPPATVAASEIASYVFCPESWRLSRLGHVATNQPARDNGILHHVRKARTERAAGASVYWGKVLLILGLIALMALLCLADRMIEILAFVAGAIVIGIMLVLGGRRARQHSGLGEGRTVALDSRALYSRRYGLAGRPDRLYREGGATIPEEWKSSRRVYDSHRAQMGVYFILTEEDTGVRPTHGFVVTSGCRRHRIENTPELRRRVLDVARRIRSARRRLNAVIPVNQPAAKCRACGQRENCQQATA